MNFFKILILDNLKLCIFTLYLLSCIYMTEYLYIDNKLNMFSCILLITISFMLGLIFIIKWIK